MPGVFVMMAPEEKARLAAAAQPGGAPAPAPPPAPRPSVLALVWKGIAWVVKRVTARVPSPTRADGEPFVKTPWIIKRAMYWVERDRVERKVRGLLVGKEMDCLCVQSECKLTHRSYGC
jgi:hypothetical protein